LLNIVNDAVIVISMGRQMLQRDEEFQKVNVVLEEISDVHL